MRQSGGSLITGIDKPISPLALGTAFYKPNDSQLCLELLDAYLEAGGTVIDTARAYGESEQVVGRWLEQRGVADRVIVITKCGHGPDFTLREEGYGETVREELSASLDALRTDVIDLYMLHRDNHEIPVGAILEPLNEAVAMGRVRALGVSNWEYRRVTEANEYARKHGLAGFAAVSNTLGLARPAAAFFPGLVHTDPVGEQWHVRTGIPLFSWSPTARGFFSGIFAPGKRIEPDSSSPEARKFASRMQKVYGADENFARLERAERLGGEKGNCSAAEIALSWLLHKPFACIPIIGPRLPQEMVSCWRALTVDLSSDEVDWLENGTGRI